MVAAVDDGKRALAYFGYCHCWMEIVKKREKKKPCWAFQNRGAVLLVEVERFETVGTGTEAVVAVAVAVAAAADD
jgi:hypothetical protein